eukprot:CAMPEP_0184318038 /NCGR_PEP_ID=MMETSP1049-20130417/100196_1 /TAXON_ID=77928 /ORGANISM="Proteomonas sulcata, Strain CCMP704" /LENGTH=233 /DNA_ID=CAMNT_0026637649 /DNA_START=150 /DNA_END=851 /DNA_ORIENTATION=-
MALSVQRPTESHSFSSQLLLSPKHSTRTLLDRNEVCESGIGTEWREVSYIVDVRTNSLSALPPSLPVGGLILHYISAGFEQWYSKYKMLGDFSQTWLGNSVPIPQCFHTVSRDMISSKSETECRRWYNARMVPDLHLLKLSLESKICIRVEAVRQAFLDLVRQSDRQRETRRAGTDGSRLADPITPPKSMASADLPGESAVDPGNAQQGLSQLDKMWLLSNIMQHHCSDQVGL